MKRLLLILILTFSFQSWTKAEDISGFQIEGMSIGDSLLDFFSEEKINLAEQIDYLNKDFYGIKLNVDSKDYDRIRVHFKQNDLNYKIYALEADKIFQNINDCYILKDNHVENLSKLFLKYTTLDKKKRKHTDPRAKDSYTTDFYFEFDNGSLASVSCYDWSKEYNEYGIEDVLRIGIFSKEFSNWLNKKAFK